MRTTRVTVRFAHGLHARAAACLVQVLRQFRCQVWLRAGNRIANAGSILSILLLAAPFNTQIEVQVSGQDEEAALRAIKAFFQHDDETAAEHLQPARPVPESSHTLPMLQPPEPPVVAAAV